MLILEIGKGIFKYVARDRKTLFVRALLLSIVSAFVELVGVASIYPFLAALSDESFIHSNKILDAIYMILSLESNRTFLIYFGIWVVLIFFVTNSMTYLKTAYITYVSTETMADLSVRVFRSVMGSPYLNFTKTNPGDMAKNILVQSDMVANGIVQFWLVLIAESLVIAVLAFLVILEDPVAGLGAFALLSGTVGVFYYVVRKRISLYGRLNDEANGERFSFCLDSINAIKEIKTLKKEEFFVRNYRPKARKHAKMYLYLGVLHALPGSILQFFLVFTIVSIAVYYLASGKEIRSIVASLSLLAVAGYRMMPSLMKISGAISQLRQNQWIFSEVISRLKNEESNPDAEALKPGDTSREKGLVVDGVSYRYPGSESDVVKKMSFHVPGNSITALVGGSGAGKTTLVDLTLGLLPLDEGDIIINGMSIRNTNLSLWREKLAYVPQSVSILDDTILANIVFGDDHDTDMEDRVWRVLELAELSEFVKSIKEGLEYRVGPGGSRLSGGQIQRLGIARALFKNPELIIMDESTSALDGITEQKILNTLHKLKSTVDVVLIAHRNSTIARCDNIILLNQGRVENIGSFDQVMSDSNLFRQLMNHAMVDK